MRIFKFIVSLGCNPSKRWSESSRGGNAGGVGVGKFGGAEAGINCDLV